MKLIWTYLKKYKKNILINLISVFGFVIIEIGIPTLLAAGINSGFNGGDQKYIISLALKMTLCAIVGLIGLLVLSYSTSRVVNNIIRDLRNDLFAKIQTFSHDEYGKFGVSRLITNTGNDSFQIFQFLVLILRTGLTAPLMFIASLVMIFRKSKILSLIVLIAVPVMMFFIYFINKKTEPYSVKQQTSLDNVNLVMRENLTGLRVVRAFNNEDFQETRFGNVNSIYSGLSKKMYRMIALIMPLFTIIFTLLMLGVFSIGSYQVNSRMLEYGTLAAFIEYVFHALFSFLMLASVFINYPRTAVSARRISQVLNSEISINENSGGVTTTETNGFVEFKNVSFAYSDDSEEPVIRNISFTASPGETVAFIGSTGSGKSTMIQLIPRFFDVTSGRILLDGVDVKDYEIKALRDKIGYVPQKALLFSGTIEENLRFGNNSATMEELKHAVDIAQGSDFIDSKPLGYQEILAEGGTNLSGGQKQRLCIARALVRKPAVYIFDDSFSALDYKTDAILRQRLSSETKNSTVLIVAQRISTIMNADKIIVINEGQIVGTGTHRELLKNSETYYEIASSQLSKEELER